MDRKYYINRAHFLYEITGGQKRDCLICKKNVMSVEIDCGFQFHESFEQNIDDGFIGFCDFFEFDRDLDCKYKH